MTGYTTIVRRKKNRHWPGVKAAAKELGVDYNHLRLCLLGERFSRSLLTRYLALDNLTSQKTETESPQPCKKR
jgi:hypothetical protein